MSAAPKKKPSRDAAYRRLRALHQDYAGVFGTDEGRRVLKDLAHASRFRNSSMVIRDPYMTAYYCGQQDLVRRICRMIGQSEIDLLVELHGRDELATQEANL